MAVVHTGGATDAQEFTSNKRLLLAAVDKFMRPEARSRRRSAKIEEYYRTQRSRGRPAIR